MRRVFAAAAWLIGLWAVPAAAQVPITFQLEQSGYVTLVAERVNAQGDTVRVRNIIQETPFTAGTHTVYWDGYDLGQVSHPNTPGQWYDLTRSAVEPGTYFVRGLVHDGIRERYEFSLYNSGNPPWHSFDGSGGWLSDHSVPFSALFIPRPGDPRLYFSSLNSEEGYSEMYTDLQGRKRWGSHGRGLGGRTGSAAYDAGANTNEFDHYTASWWNEGGGMRLRVIGTYIDSPNHNPIWETVLPNNFNTRSEQNWEQLAVHNKVLVLANFHRGVLHVMNADQWWNGNNYVGDIPINRPTGVAFQPDGRLLVASGTTIRRYTLNVNGLSLGNEEVLVTGLQDPRQLALDAQGNIYVTDWGTSHQVKVFSPSGQPLRTIGSPGGPHLGLYDETRMHFPRGIAVTNTGDLWVAEFDGAPKRISRWNAQTGTFSGAFYGPTKYGGGGRFDPTDRSRYYYSDEVYTQAGGVDNVLIEFAVDWTARTSRPHRILWRKQSEALERNYPSVSSLSAGARTPYRGAGEVSYHVNGRQYFTDAFQGTGNTEAGVFTIWMRDGDEARQVAVIGRVGSNGHGADPDQVSWRRLADSDIAPLWNGMHRGETMFVWHDANGNREAEPGEFAFFAHPNLGWGSWYVAPDLSIVGRGGVRITPTFDGQGVPRYDLNANGQVLANVNDSFVRDSQPGTRMPVVIGDRLVQMGGPIVGYDLATGRERWRYDNQWPGDYEVQPGPGGYPGQIKRTGRLLGPAFEAPQGEAGAIMALNGYYGEMYLITADGYFLATLGADKRTSPLLRANTEGEVTYLDGISPSDEHYWPGLHLTEGEVFLTLGKERISVARLEGLETVRRLDLGTVTVTPEMVAGLDPVQENADAQEEVEAVVHLRSVRPRLDGQLADWNGADWMTIDAARQIRAAMAVHGDTLYAAFDTNDANLLANSLSSGPAYAFTTGGGLDLLLNVSGNTDAPRYQTINNEFTHTPVPGDLRLFVTRNAAGAPVAVVFEQAATQQMNPQTYTSPIRQLTVRRVENVSNRLRLAQSGGGYEIAIPVSALSLAAQPGLVTLGDVGVVLGNGIETQSRRYWSNQSATHVSDVPSEAEITPMHWGGWTFAAGGDPQGGAPTATITSPSAGATFTAPASITVRVEAASPTGSLAGVRFFANGEAFAERAAPPYEATLTGVGPGTVVLTAEAVGDSGQTGQAAPVTVTVVADSEPVGEAQVIGLGAGWNLVSAHVAPGDPAMAAVFAGVLAELDAPGLNLMVKSGDGRTFMPELGVTDLATWEDGHAYMVYVSNGVALALDGEALLPEATPIALAEGWNQTAYLRRDAMPLAQAVASLGDALVMAKDGAGGVLIPALGIDEIGVAEPGRGYKLYVAADATLLYPADAGALAEGEGTDLPRIFPSGNPTATTATLIVEAPDRLEGARVEAHAHGEAVAAGVIADGRAVLRIAGATTEKEEGVREGTALTLHLVREGEAAPAVLREAEHFLSGQAIAGALTFAEDAVWRVTLDDLPTTLELGQAYPNPFASSTTLTYTLPRDTHVEVQIFNVLGQRILTLVEGHQEAGRHEVVFEGRGLASGTYLYRLRAGSETLTRRMQLVR